MGIKAITDGECRTDIFFQGYGENLDGMRRWTNCMSGISYPLNVFVAVSFL